MLHFSKFPMTVTLGGFNNVPPHISPNQSPCLHYYYAFISDEHRRRVAAVLRKLGLFQPSKDRGEGGGVCNALLKSEGEDYPVSPTPLS